MYIYLRKKFFIFNLTYNLNFIKNDFATVSFKYLFLKCFVYIINSIYWLKI